MFSVRTLLTSCALVLLCLTSVSVAETFHVKVAAQGDAKRAVPLKVDVAVPKSFADVTLVELTIDGGESLYGQLTKPGLGNPAADPLARELHMVLPKTMVGPEREFAVSIPKNNEGVTEFHFQDEAGKYKDLLFGDRPVLRYMYEAVDSSSEDRRHETMKVYHHLFDPEGKNLLTKGPGGLFQHHRGIFYGFNRISYDQDGKTKSADVWHCNKKESQTHEAFVREEVGPVMARQLLEINWNGQDGKTFATELREMTVYHVDGAQVIDFTSELTSMVDNLKVDGDPQHAGFQYRATQHVPDKTAKQTYYVRPDGKGEPGKFRNWPGNKDHINLEFNALSFVAFDQRYTCCYLDSPANPKPARFSERDYGRFGSYFATEIPGDKPLELNYRIWLQPGEMDVAEIKQLRDDFVDPPKVTVEAG
ncbi:hypothetical protein C5Y96_16150 [Blastopirellula marina]|uniref:DUF4861 domain-containing protein n=1 Tax=Blastopirellula marina TaxID=124 RepID=A0A2S8F7K9_9BACT|nr:MULTISPECIES: DUF6807 family protein [Pirellulaceae]PQO27914.1 hypothetical protein C5Y96_16150 [Blastopirellula marina]RCS48339.1 hypothetical protein DTL36_16170 [Bremerella cremea]